MASKLEIALNMTKEEDHNAFERFANSFLIPDYPELEGLGGKHDKGMDARIVDDESGQIILVVQCCVSPAATARTKILKTVQELIKHGNLPTTLVYCTSATIKLALDDTKKELRRDHKLALVVHDAVWFCQREHSTRDRSVLSENYARGVLEPILKQLDPSHLYSGVLSDEEERIVIQYLEAQSLDRVRGGNLTKSIFDAFVVYAMRNNESQHNVLTQDQIVTAICKMFPDGHRERIAQIVPGRIEKLTRQKMIHFNTAGNGYVLSNAQREKLETNIVRGTNRELTFRAALQTAIKGAAEDREIDYEYDIDGLAKTAHDCILWYMHEQGKRFVDPLGALSNLLSAERLINLYLEANPPDKGNSKCTRQIIVDILPHALFTTLNSTQEKDRQYLRAKADLFILQAFLQITPDVQGACKKILGNDIIYLDTTILIRCIAELFSDNPQRPLIQVFRNAQKLGVQLRTWKPYIDELVSHLKGPVLLEWQNHVKYMPPDLMEPYLRTAPTLIGVLHKHTCKAGSTVESIVHEMIGDHNEVENAIEFIREELFVTTEELPSVDEDAEQHLWREAFEIWLNGKRRLKILSENRFELLVRNDVNAYVGLIKLRKTIKLEGRNYGHKIWLLTLDRMPWRMPRLLGEEKNSLFHVAMSLDYLINYVATLANASSTPLPDEILPATAIIEESERVSSELREVFVAEWKKTGKKKYVRERRLRDLAHDLKSSIPVTEDQGADSTGKVDVQPDEQI